MNKLIIRLKSGGEFIYETDCRNVQSGFMMFSENISKLNVSQDDIDFSSIRLELSGDEAPEKGA